MSKDGGPAFPCVDERRQAEARAIGAPAYTYSSAGMSLRDYFAAAALTGALTDHDNTARMVELSQKENMSIEEYIARSMYSIADAMLMERQQ